MVIFKFSQNYVKISIIFTYFVCLVNVWIFFFKLSIFHKNREICDPIQGQKVNFHFRKNLRFLVGFLPKISISSQNFDFLSKFRFLVKISISCQNFYFLSKFLFLVKISISGQNFDFLSKFWFFCQNFNYFYIFSYPDISTQLSIFPKFRCFN